MIRKSGAKNAPLFECKFCHTQKSISNKKKQHCRVLSNFFSADEIVYANVEKIGKLPKAFNRGLFLAV